MAKATSAEVDKRVQQVYKSLLAGLTRPQIILRYASTWEVSDRQIDTYIKRAGELLAQESSFHRKQEFGKAKGRLDALFRQARKDKDTRAAVAVQKEINTLLSLYLPPPVQTLQLLGVDREMVALLDAELQAHGMTLSRVIQTMLKELQSGQSPVEMDQPFRQPDPDENDLDE